MDARALQKRYSLRLRLSIRLHKLLIHGYLPLDLSFRNDVPNTSAYQSMEIGFLLWLKSSPWKLMNWASSLVEVAVAEHTPHFWMSIPKPKASLMISAILLSYCIEVFCMLQVSSNRFWVLSFCFCHHGQIFILASLFLVLNLNV